MSVGGAYESGSDGSDGEGLSIGPDGWVYSVNNTGSIENPSIGDWRQKIEPHPSITDLTIRTSQRFNVSWETVLIEGVASILSSGFLIDRGSEGFGYGNAVTPIQTLINIAPGLDGSTVGSTEGDTAIISEAGPFALHADPITYTEITQPDGSELLTLPFDVATESYLYIFEITESLTTIENGVSIYIDASSDVTGATLRAGNLLPDGADAIQSDSLDSFQAGDSQVAIIGENNIVWEREYPVQKGVTHFGFIQSNKPLVIQGKTIDLIFTPKFKREIHSVELQSILSLPSWSEKTYSVKDWIIEGAANFPTQAKIYTCNTEGPQTGDFASNIDKWDSLDSRPLVGRVKVARSLDLILSLTEQAIPFDPALTSVSEGFTVLANGNVKVEKDGYYTGDLSAFIDKTGGVGTPANISFWVERKPLLTGVWELASPTMINPLFFTDGGHAVMFSDTVNLIAGDEIRIKVKLNSGSAILKSVSITSDLGLLTQHAAAISIYRVGDLPT